MKYEATEYDLGPSPVINGKLTSEYPDAAIKWQHHIRLKRTKKENGKCWAITDGSFVLGMDNNWVLSPTPSETSDEFIKKTRFDTIEEAVSFYEKWKDYILIEFKKG